VVTGASGHVGATLIRQLCAAGRPVRALDLQHGEGLDGLDVERHTGDVRDADFIRQHIQPGDTVYHLASVISTSGDKDGLVASVNVEGARNMARIALEKQVRRMVHFSSIHAYDIDTFGSPVTEQTRGAVHNSDSAYNCSKWQGQQAVLEVAAEGLDVVIVNPTGIIGPYDYKTSRMGKFFRSYAKKKNPPPGPGGFNWVDVRDVIAGAMAAEERGQSGEAYILSGHYVTNIDLARIAAGITGTEPPKKAMSWWFCNTLVAVAPLMRMMGAKIPVTKEALDALRCNPDMPHDKATQALGYQPRPIEETVKDILAWYEDEDILAREKARREKARQARQAG
jgi:dihydroflavonol-4-reductase